MYSVYELSYITTFIKGHSKCVDKIRQSFNAMSVDERLDTMIDMFHKRKLPYHKFLTNHIIDGKYVQKIREAIYFVPFTTLHLTKEQNDYIFNKLADFYDPEMSKYGPATYNTSVGGIGGGSLFDATGVLKGRNKTWFYKNCGNECVIVKKDYDENGERLYDAKPFLESMCGKEGCL